MMGNFLESASKQNNAIAIFLILFMLPFLIGSFIPKNPIGDYGIVNQDISFVKIFVNNSLFSLLILIGGFTFGVLSSLCIANSAFLIGFYFGQNALNKDFLSSFLILLPHLIIEMVWMFIFLKLSFIIATNFYCIIERNQKNLRILSTRNYIHVIYGYSLVALGAAIEKYISPNLIDKF